MPREGASFLHARRGRQRRRGDVALLIALVLALPVDAQQSGGAGRGRDVGFNYFSETFTNPWYDGPSEGPRTFLPKTSEQRTYDFTLMRRLHATAVRIHGGNNPWVFDAAREAKGAGLRVWLSYRPTIKDLLGTDGVNPDAERAICATIDERTALRTKFIEDFSAFAKKAKEVLTPLEDCLVVANELWYDLGYRLDTPEESKGYDASHPSMSHLLLQVVAEARRTLGDRIELTYASLPPIDKPDEPDESDKIDWKALKGAGLDFVSLNCYWAEGYTLSGRLKALQDVCHMTVALSEFGSLTCPNARTLDGDGSKVNAPLLADYRKGEEQQAVGLGQLTAQLADVPLRGAFFFCWDDPLATGFGLVRPNCMPRGLDSQPSEDWKSGSIRWQLDTFVPTGKPGLVPVVAFIGGTATQVESGKGPLLTKVTLTTAPGKNLWRVELYCHARGVGPGEDRRASAAGNVLQPAYSARTFLCHALQLGDFEHGRIFWSQPRSSETKESFVTVDDSANYWVRPWWSAAEQPGAWIRLDRADALPQKTYDAASDAITVTFGAETTVPVPEPVEPPPEKAGMCDVVFCIDISGSMRDDIEAVQASIVPFLDALQAFARAGALSLQVGLVTYVRQDAAQWLAADVLTSDVAAIRSYIEGIRISDPSLGAQGNEDVYGALMYAMNQKVGDRCLPQERPPGMGWRGGAAKFLVPIGDEPPDESRFSLQEVAGVAAALDPVHVYPVVLPRQETGSVDAAAGMRRIAEATGGEVVRVDRAADLPNAMVAVIKLAVRRHREEVWRASHVPYLLYSVCGALGVLVVFAIVFGGIAHRRRTARSGLRSVGASTASDTMLTGETPVNPRRPKAS